MTTYDLHDGPMLTAHEFHPPTSKALPAFQLRGCELWMARDGVLKTAWCIYTTYLDQLGPWESDV